jgi:SAM-dependent methyltransferase
MKLRNSNSWHRSLYGTEFARRTIGSERFADLAEKQVDFLLSVLEPAEGARILDVPCGTGRHSVLFGRRGFRVTGIDISRDCLRLAHRQAAHRNVRYLHGDMAKLGRFRGRFDLVVNLFTSFGYFATDKQNAAVLRGMVRALNPGGRVVLNLIDREYLLPIFNPSRWSESDDLLVVESSRYEPKTKYNASHMFMVDKRAGRVKPIHYHYHRIRIYSKPELVRLMKACGLRNIKVFGDFEGNKYVKGKSSHPVYIGEIA